MVMQTEAPVTRAAIKLPVGLRASVGLPFSSQRPEPPKARVELPVAFEELFRPHRYKVWWGGRGGTKSWTIARALINIAHTQRGHRILCARELQTSIKDSVHRLLDDQISKLGLAHCFSVTQTSIVSLVTGSEFIFKGLRHNANEIKSTEGITICWVEEAQLVSKDSWEWLIPTIRRDDVRLLINGQEIICESEIWVSFNPVDEIDDTYTRFVPFCETCRKAFDSEHAAYKHQRRAKEHALRMPPPGSICRQVNWNSNPWFPSTLERERQYALSTQSPEDYAHVWEGAPQAVSEAIIFKGRYVIEAFQTPGDPTLQFFHGADFGFGPSPACLVRAYKTVEKAMPHPLQPGKMLPAGEHLWVDAESFGYGIEQDDLPALYDAIPTSRSWPIKADSARPETISHLRRRGFSISGADKWQGSVEDGIYHLKQFVLIHIHQRCKNASTEARMYKYKVDQRTKQVLPIIVDAWNHFWDALRYAFDGYIKRRGASEVWSNL